MRTTIDLPAELLRSAKVRAVEQGLSLKELFARALSRELGVRATEHVHTRVSLPLVGVADHPKVDVSNEDMADIFAAEDAEKYGGM